MARRIWNAIDNTHPLTATIENYDDFSIMEFVDLAILAARSGPDGKKAIAVGFQSRDHATPAICRLTISALFQNWNIEVVCQGNAGYWKCDQCEKYDNYRYPLHYLKLDLFSAPAVGNSIQGKGLGVCDDELDGILSLMLLQVRAATGQRVSRTIPGHPLNGAGLLRNVQAIIATPI